MLTGSGSDNSGGNGSRKPVWQQVSGSILGLHKQKLSDHRKVITRYPTGSHCVLSIQPIETALNVTWKKITTIRQSPHCIEVTVHVHLSSYSFVVAQSSKDCSLCSKGEVRCNVGDLILQPMTYYPSENPTPFEKLIIFVNLLV